MSHKTIAMVREISPQRALGRKLSISLFIMAVVLWAAASANGQQVRPDSFADLAEELLPAVVNISTVQMITREQNRPEVPNLPENSPFQDFFDDFFDEENTPQPRRTQTLGSGFLISSDGYIVTNNHVIDEADSVTVTFVDGESHDAIIVGRDALLDVALLKIEAGEELPYVSFGDSDIMRVGDWVVTIGNPFGLGGSVTAGIVSGLHRDINSGQYDYFIQTDASINRGNSGGPMFDLDGNVIGVNTMIFSPNGGNIGIGFAIPSNDVSRVVDQLKEFGRARRGLIGVTIQPVSEDVAAALGLDEASGAIVASVTPDGPADRAGIKVSDVIIAFGGQPIATNDELPRVVANTGVGVEVAVEVWRSGQVLTLTLVTAELPAAEVTTAANSDTNQPDQVDDLDTLMGMRLAPLDSSLRAEFEIPDDIDGVMVTGVLANGTAAARGMARGDLIVQVNQRNVEGSDDIEEVIEDARKADRTAVLLRIYRDGSYFLIPLPIPSEE